MRYLLDTNIIAEPTKPQPNQQVLDRIAQFEGEVANSSVTQDVSDFIHFNGLRIENWFD
jgi:predicted nucleic acid-binding protein